MAGIEEPLPGSSIDKLRTLIALKNDEGKRWHATCFTLLLVIVLPEVKPKQQYIEPSIG